jgi:asparagine synthase (glutamine-hydrolysing)
VSRLAQKHVKVVLTGEGSDELLGGYERYHQTLYNLRAGRALSSLFPEGAASSIFRPIIEALPYWFPLKRKAVRTILYLRPDVETIFLDNYATFSRSHLRRLLRSGIWNFSEIDAVYSGYMTHFNRPRNYSLLNRLLYADIKTYLLELLMKQDQMSMAASIESRVPFLDHKLVEFVFTLPEALKVSGLKTKRVLREAYGSSIPREILHRPKAGFPVPLSRWLAGPYHDVAKRIVLGKDSFSREIMNPEEIERCFRLHREGRTDYSYQIWSLLNLELWNKIFIRRVPPDNLEVQPEL